MTNTPHGQVPEALRLAHIFDNPLPPEWPDMVAAAAELRHQHTRIAELEAQIEALSGVQALSAAPEAIAKLRHLYQNMVNGAVRDTASAKRIAEGLLAPAIEALERATPPAEQQAAQVIINFPQVGTAGPFPVVDGRVSLPDCTMQDLVRMLRPTYEAEQQAEPGAVGTDEECTRRGCATSCPAQQAAPQPAPAPLSEMPYEKRKAIQEGEQISASDAWFKARHEMLDTVDRRNVFRAGFDRGWNAAIAAQGGK